MLDRSTRWGTAFLVVVMAGAAHAQFTKLVTDFENYTTQQDFLAEIIFEDPSTSGTTRGLDIPLGNDSYLSNITTSPSPFTEVSSGIRSYVVYWAWANPNDHTSWVRLVTLNTANIPNPSLHLGGKVRMKMGARAFTDGNFTTQVPGGSLYLGMAVRETGVGAPQGGNGGVTGLIEWVNLDDKLAEIVSGVNGVCDTAAAPGTDDVQIVPVGMPAPNNGTCIDGGTNGIINTTVVTDDVVTSTPIGDISIPADGVMRSYAFDLPALQTAGKVVGFTGDGVLGATPNNRGTLEHLAIVNKPANGPINAKVWLLFIDDVEFEAPIIDPPTIVTLPNPPRPLDEEVMVQAIDPAADLVELILLPDTVVGSIDPNGAASLSIPTSPLPANVEIVARQTVGVNVSDNSAPVAVVPFGNGPLRLAAAVRETNQYDNALACGDDGTGFDPDQPSTLEFVGTTTTTSFGIPNGKRYEPQADWFEVTFDPCADGVAVFSGNGVIDLAPAGDTKNVWEGLYFRIDNVNPTDGPFTVYLDDVILKNGNGPGQDCVVDDFEGYLVEEVITEGATAGTADSIAVGDDIQVLTPGSSTFAGQIIITAGPNRVIDTTPASGEGVFSRHARFNYPGVAGTSVGVATTPNLTALTDEDSFSGTQSLKVEWAFVNATNLSNTLRLTTNGSTATFAPEALVGPDPVVNVTNAGCADGVDIAFSVMMKLLPPPVPGDCDLDGDVDLEDYGCFQRCNGASPVPPECEKVSLAPNGAPDATIDLGDYELFSILLSGPK